MTYICGLTKNEYDELLNSFVTQFVGRVVDEGELSYDARAELAHLLVATIEKDDNGLVDAYCTKHDLPVTAITKLLEGGRTIWVHELIAETGQIP